MRIVWQKSPSNRTFEDKVMIGMGSQQTQTLRSYWEALNEKPIGFLF